jgi:hypothetical protein
MRAINAQQDIAILITDHHALFARLPVPLAFPMGSVLLVKSLITLFHFQITHASFVMLPIVLNVTRQIQIIAYNALNTIHTMT